MRTALLLSLILAVPADAPAQAPAGQPPPAAAPATSKPQPAAPRAAQPARRTTPSRAGMAITVTTPSGATIPSISVEVLGSSDRAGMTNDSGQINFTGMQAGSYRVRFTGDEVIAFEREVTLRANQVADVDITLYPAPPPKVVTIEAESSPAAAAAPAPPAAAGPAGQPQTLSIVDLLEKEFVGRQPRRETLLSCSGDLRTTMIQLNEPQPDRLYDVSEASYYVLAGEGTLRLDGRETKLQTNGFVSVPRGVRHSFVRRGNRPFVLLATLSGTPCEEPR